MSGTAAGRPYRCTGMTPRVRSVTAAAARPPTEHQLRLRRVSEKGADVDGIAVVRPRHGLDRSRARGGDDLLREGTERQVLIIADVEHLAGRLGRAGREQ